MRSLAVLPLLAVLTACPAAEEPTPDDTGANEKPPKNTREPEPVDTTETGAPKPAPS